MHNLLSQRNHSFSKIHRILEKSLILAVRLIDIIHNIASTIKLVLSRFVKTFPCVTVYMSSLTNMAIAVDRYRFIVRSQSLQVASDDRLLNAVSL